MQTLRWRIDAAEINSAQAREAIPSAAALLRAGETVAFPTETVYGLGANALDAAAVSRIFTAKQRPAWDPVIVHIADAAMLGNVIAALATKTKARLEVLTDAFWPGPLTLLLPRSARVPDSVTAGRALVGVRMPAHPVANALIAEAGVPVAAPSANRFGHVSPTTADHVLADLDGRIAGVVDAGPCRIGVESTVLDITAEMPVLYRPGGVTREQLEAVLREDIHAFRENDSDAAPESLPSPGVGIRHYAPRAALLLVDGPESLLRATTETAGCGAMLPAGWSAAESAVLYRWGAWNDAATLSARLYDGLRRLDSQGVGTIVCPMPPGTPDNAALRDRLRKAARKP